MIRRTVTGPRCSMGADCVSYPALGQPSKLSRGNPGPECFACQERRAASELATAAKRKTGGGRSTVLEHRPAERHERKPLTCAKRYCGRPGAEWDGAAYLCPDHAAAQRARAVHARRKDRVVACEEGLRSARASGDEAVELRWWGLLREAERRLAVAEADLVRAEREAWSEPR